MSFTYEVRANTPKNRLYLKLVGTMSDEDAKKVADTILAEIRKLKPGFAVVNDISALKPASQAATDQLRRAQDASVKQGVGRVVRVVGEQTITNMQWNRTLKDTQGIRADTATTVAEADKMLDNG
jgi:predicted methyltransferase